MSDAPLEDCPACSKATLKKKISAVAFRLKGSGWYETDFKTGDKKNLAGDSKPDSKASTSSGSDGSTTKSSSGESTKSDSNIAKSSGESKSTAKSPSSGGSAS
jgi:predicted nucleic acid-binding Zn ribbon protein